MYLKKKLSIIVYIWLVFGLVLKYYLINKYVCSRIFFFFKLILMEEREYVDLMIKLIVD